MLDFIVSAIAVGMVLGAIGFMLVVFVGPMLRFPRKVKEVRIFLTKLDEKYPIKTITNEMREERERELIDSGYGPNVISKAQRLNSIKLNKEEKQCQKTKRKENKKKKKNKSQSQSQS